MASKLDSAPSSPLCNRDHGEQHSPIQLPPLPAAPHKPIVTHRRSQRIRAQNAKKTPFAPATPKHHKICRDINVNRRRRQSSSPPRPQSSPYHGIFESSPYRFDDELVLPIIDTKNIFVQPMRLSLIMLSLTTDGSLLICQTVFTFLVENPASNHPPRPLVRLLPVSADVNNPISFFSMYFDDEEFELLAERTNKYAKHWFLTHPSSTRDQWHDCTADEIRIYFAVLIFLGIQCI